MRLDEGERVTRFEGSFYTTKGYTRTCHHNDLDRARHTLMDVRVFHTVFEVLTEDGQHGFCGTRGDAEELRKKWKAAGITDAISIEEHVLWTPPET